MWGDRRVWVTGQFGQTELLEDGVVTFGRGDPEAPVDIVLDRHNGAVPRLVGWLHRSQEVIWIKNKSAYSLVVQDSWKNTTIQLGPFGSSQPVRIDDATIIIPNPTGVDFEISLTVRSGSAPLVACQEPDRPAGGSATEPVELPRDTSMFFVLVALAEPRLRLGADAYVPGNGEVAQRLRSALGDGMRTEKVADAVSRLAGKLELSIEGSPEHRRHEIVRRAISLGRVTRADLSLIERD